MPVSPVSNSRLRAVCSVSQMASMVGLSRARFYELMERGVFTPPVYSLSTRRPFFLREMQERNLEVRRDQFGVNGEYVIFYEPRQEPTRAQRSPRRVRSEGPSNELARRLLPQLQSLGLSDISADAVAQAITGCFPSGVGETAESEVLRSVFRHLRRQNTA